MKRNNTANNLAEKCINSYFLFCAVLPNFNFRKSFFEKVGKIQFSSVLLSERQNKFFSQVKKLNMRGGESNEFISCRNSTH